MDVRGLMAGHAPAAPAPSGPSAFTGGQIAVATLLGTPVAGAVLMAINYRRDGKGTAGVVAILLALLVTGFQLTAARYVSPIALPVVFLPPLVLMVFIAGHHVNEVSPRPRGSVVAMLGAVAIGGVVAVGAWQVLPRPPFVKYAHGGIVRYDQGVSRAQARVIGDALDDAGYFDDQPDLEVHVYRDFGYTIAHIPTEAGFYDPYYERIYAQVAPGFDPPLRFELSGLYNRRDINPDDLPTIRNHRL